MSLIANTVCLIITSPLLFPFSFLPQPMHMIWYLGRGVCSPFTGATACQSRLGIHSSALRVLDSDMGRSFKIIPGAGSVACRSLAQP